MNQFPKVDSPVKVLSITLNSFQGLTNQMLK